ncbi:MAG: NAD-dependent deacylase [Thermoleophilia bacterium]|nr:NAD-dependent deacylase [Thermoleophilia bacterium]MDH3724490.1 NAD-dependent deacylase [Thermoleophilia bacterium]
MDDSPEALAQLLSDAEHAIALTGAGMSTESGIPDFRSAEGMWQRFDPMEVASLQTFLRKPERFWQFHRPRIDMLSAVAPNPAHEAIAELQRRRVLHSLVTQNIDRLHSRAGSTDVIEVHGSLSRGECLQCQAMTTLEELVVKADGAADGVPRCDACGFQLKSGVVMFGESLPAAEISAAYEAAERADVILVVGSSLQVAPVSELPSIVRRRGGKLAILTEGDTPYDSVADVRLRGKAAVQLVETVAALDASQQRN